MIGDKIEIVPFRDEFAGAFAKLNYEWIEKYFRVEAHDRELLDSPVEQIIRKGGEIFFAVLGNKPIGTVALVLHTSSEFELTKMAVASEFQGRGIGKLLMKELIARARQAGIHVMVGGIDASNLRSLEFHRRLGFREVARMPETGFKHGRWCDLVFVQREV